MYDSRDFGFVNLGSSNKAAIVPVTEDVHPLVHIRTLVDDRCEGAVHGPLIRAALLQALYSFQSQEQLLEQLRYNALYRWFVGLRSDEQPWTECEYASSLSALRRDEQGASLFRQAVLDAHAYAALIPGRFRIDAGLLEQWSRLPMAGTSGSGHRRADSARTSRFDRAHAVILRRVADPTLDADAIAAELFMSRRALYLLFERYDLTPTRAIREIRLDCCLRLLRDERQQHRKITDIALDHGFQHFASFSRQFKQRYGVSPSAVRGARLLVGTSRNLPRAVLERMDRAAVRGVLAQTTSR